VHGIMRQYYDGLEEITVDWFDQENSDVVKRRLAEHFARNSMACSIYYNKVQEIYDYRHDFRNDILLGAEKTELFPILKAKDLRQSTMDLFGDTIGSEIIDNISRSATPARLPRKTVLMFFAAPIDQDNIDLDDEMKQIEATLNGVNKAECDIKITPIFKARSEEIHSNILSARPEILHFSGHGNENCLAFENPINNTSIIAGDSLLRLCTIYKDSIQCVVLNSCYSERILAKLPDEIPVLIGCNDGIADFAAKTFSANFYGALKAGKEYEQAFNAAIHQLELSNLKDEANKYSIMKMKK